MGELSGSDVEQRVRQLGSRGNRARSPLGGEELVDDGDGRDLLVASDGGAELVVGEVAGGAARSLASTLEVAEADDDPRVVAVAAQS